MAVTFDGIDDLINCGTDASLDLTTGSIACWFKWTKRAITIALVVRDTSSPDANDSAIKAWLESLGYTVTYEQDDTHDYDPTDYDFIFIAVSTFSFNNAWLKSEVVPVLTTERIDMDKFDLATSQNAPADDDVRIANISSYIAREYTVGEIVAVSDDPAEVGWAKGWANDVIVIANSEDNSTEAVILTCDIGCTLADSTIAAEKRIAFLPCTFANLTTAGKDLLNRCIVWSTGQYIISKDNQDGSSGNISIGISSDDKVKVEITDATGQGHSIFSNTAISEGEWYHLATSFGSAGMKLYVNGSLQSDIDSYTGGINNASSSLIFGCKVSGISHFKGDITEVCIWNKQLSTYSIQRLASATYKGAALQIDANEIVSCYRLDDVAIGVSGDGETFTDDIGSNNGTGDDGANNTGLVGSAEVLEDRVIITKNVLTTDLTVLEEIQLRTTNAPYYYVTIVVDGVEYEITDYLDKVPIIERKKEILPETASGLKPAAAIFTMINDSRYFSPNEPSSLFYGSDYFDSPIIIYAGFWVGDNEVTVTSQLKVYLQEVRIDTYSSTAKLITAGVISKIERVTIGQPDEDGNADPLTYTGTQTFKNILEDLLTTHGGLTSADYSVQDISLSFTDISFTNTKLTSAISLLCQAGSAEVYEDRFGRITITKFEPTIGGNTTVSLTDSDVIGRLFGSTSTSNLINNINVSGSGSVYSTETIAGNTTGRVVSISNDYIQTTTVSDDVLSRHIERYGQVALLLQCDIDYLPALDINQIVNVTETQSVLNGAEYEVYRIILDLENFKGLVYLLPSSYDANFGFFASNTAEAEDSLAPEEDNYDDASIRDRQFAYFGDRSDLTSTAPNYVYARR